MEDQMARMSLSRKSASPEKPLGKEIEMSEEGVLAYCREKQKNKEVLNLNMMCFAMDGPAKFELSGRAHAVKIVKDVMMNNSKPIDRYQHPIMVCCGLSGLGKTRMLQEWDLYWKNAGVTGKRAGVLVLYENGHALSLLDATIGWEASVAWRFLHRVFLEENMGSKVFDEWFRKELPKNAKELTMSMAINVLKCAMVQSGALTEGEMLNLFVGIDEYQRIADFDSLLSGLRQCVFLPNINIFFMMAGLEWVPFAFIRSRSSSVFTLRIPMSLLDHRSAEAMLDSNEKSRVLLNHVLCRRHVFFLGGVPRFVEQYAKYILGANFEKEPNFDDGVLKEAFIFVFRDFIHRVFVFKGLRPRLRLIAYALRGQPVNPDDVPRIAVAMKNGRETVYPDHLNWRQLSDVGVCLLVTRSGKYYVDIPYCVLSSCAAPEQDFTMSEKLFVRSISDLSSMVDCRLFALEPWQLWEKFGACFHALRINALLVLAGKDEMVCSLRDVFAGSMMGESVSALKVLLRPVKVVLTSEKFSSDLGEKVKQAFSTVGYWNWLQGESEDGKVYSYVLVNGTSGKGADIFFALKKAICGGYCIITDQRNREAKDSMSDVSLKTLVEKASTLPKCAGEDSEVIVGIFNVFPQTIPSIPHNCFFVGANETENYHGCLKRHPASDPRVFVNSDHQSALALIDGISADTAKKIIERREKKQFQSIDEFVEWLKKECDVTLNGDQLARLVIP